MAKEVILTATALKDYENLIEYLTSNWSISTANDFVSRFERVLILLSENASIYSFVDEVKQVQKCILTKHNIIYFKEMEQVIKILVIFDARQNPEKLIFFI